MVPLVRKGPSEPRLVLLVELVDLFELVRSLCNEGTLSENLSLVFHAILGAESIDVGEQLLLWNTMERVGHVGPIDSRDIVVGSKLFVSLVVDKLLVVGRSDRHLGGCVSKKVRVGKGGIHWSRLVTIYVRVQLRSSTLASVW